MCSCRTAAALAGIHIIPGLTSPLRVLPVHHCHHCHHCTTVTLRSVWTEVASSRLTARVDCITAAGCFTAIVFQHVYSRYHNQSLCLPLCIEPLSSLLAMKPFRLSVYENVEFAKEAEMVTGFGLFLTSSLSSWKSKWKSALLVLSYHYIYRTAFVLTLPPHTTFYIFKEKSTRTSNHINPMNKGIEYTSL